MSYPTFSLSPRILIVDDNPAIHDDFRKILGVKSPIETRLEVAEASLFGKTKPSVERIEFRIDSACQGQEALQLVQQALAENDPYVLAFVDVRMPPGWDGIETLERIWQSSPELQAVICTAYSDYSWDDMTLRLGQTDNLLILKKPFETVEVLQLTHALTQKWKLARQAKLRMDDLDHMVCQRTTELRASEERFSKAFQASPIPLAILRCDNNWFLDANPSFTGLTGYSIDQLLQHSDKDLQLWAGETPASIPMFSFTGPLRHQSYLLRRKDGASRQVILSTEPLTLDTMPCLLLTIEDITDQLKLQSQLRRAQKMEVIGLMAAGIAHEFNNLLTVIQGDVGLLQSVNPSMLDRRALLDQIMQASQRAAAFTRQLLAFSRQQVLQPRPLNLSLLALRMKKMLSRLIGERFEIQLHCPEEIPAAMADEGGVEQVLINLVLNARDAMVDGGKIEISTHYIEIQRTADFENSEARPGRFICMTVADCGSGMTPDVISRIFDPFFTTKEVGKGTGLGLSTIHGIVKQHEGWVEVASEVGRGSAFKIYFPVCDARPAAIVKPAQARLPDPGHGETVLVVEDEISVRDLACSALARRGYRVLKASDGQEALAIWEKSSEPVELLLTDMVMPNGMSGGELARVLQGRNPRLKVIYTSGYSPEIVGDHSLLGEQINFLPKPYDLQGLLNAVRLCLNGDALPRCEIPAREMETAMHT